MNHKHQRIIRWRKVSVTLVIVGQASITAYKNTIWWWEMGHLWGWNVLQVVKLRRDGVKGGGGRSWSNLSAGYSSEKKQSKKDERISFFSPNIALTFFPLFHKNAWEEEESCTCFPRVRTLLSSSKSPGPWKCVIYSAKLINVWNAGWYLLRRQLYQCNPHT